MVVYTQKAVRNSLILIVMSLFSSALSYGTVVFLARSLGPADYGLFNAVFTFTLFFLFIRDLGITQALTKFIAEFNAVETPDREHKIKTTIILVLGLQLLSSALIALFFFFSSSYLAEHYFKNAEAAVMLRLLIIYLFASLFYGTIKDILLGYQKTFYFSLAEVLKSGLVIALAFLFLRLGKGIFSPIYAYIAACSLAIILFLPALCKLIPFFKTKLVDIKAITKRVLLFGIPAFATAVGSKIMMYIDTLFLTYYRTLAEVGVYNAMLPSSSIVAHLVGGAVSTMILPLSAELWYKKETKKMAEGISLLYKYISIITLPLVLGAVMFAPFMIRLFFGTEYLSGVLSFQILLVGMFLFAPASINHSVLAGMGKPFLVTKVIFICAAVNAGLNLFLIPAFGINGAAAATSVSYLLALLLSTYQISRQIELKTEGIMWTRLLCSGIVFVVVVYLLSKVLEINPGFKLFISGAGGLLAYVVVVLKLKLVNIEEIRYYWKIVRRTES